MCVFVQVIIDNLHCQKQWNVYDVEIELSEKKKDGPRLNPHPSSPFSPASSHT